MYGFLKKYSERIDNSRKNIDTFYKYGNSYNVPIFFTLSPFYMLKDDTIEVEDYFKDPYTSLEIQIESIRQHLELINDDYVPFLFPYFGACAQSSGFGGKVIFYNDKDPWLAEKVIKDVRDIDKLKKPDVENAGLMKGVFKLMRIWKREVKDLLPIGLTDYQGPLSIAIDLMGVQEFLLGINDFPKKIKNLLEIITDYLVDSITISYKIIGERENVYFNGMYISHGYGKVTLSEDSLAFISPEICKEFLKPCSEKIFHEVGGGVVHWCGNGLYNLDEVLKIKELKGSNNSSLGDLKIIEEQNKVSIDKKIFYDNSFIFPSVKWFKKLTKSLDKRFLINRIIVPSDEFGVSFNGYKKIEGTKLECINKLLDLNNEIV
jgi:hypothetical protein